MITLHVLHSGQLRGSAAAQLAALVAAGRRLLLAGCFSVVSLSLSHSLSVALSQCQYTGDAWACSSGVW
jgi:hypothetical protein